MLNRTLKDATLRYTREQVFLVCVLVLFALLVFRLAQLQLVSHRKYLARAVGNKVQVVRIPPPRGEIFDRSGAPLALNKPSFALKYFFTGEPSSYSNRNVEDKSHSGIPTDDERVISTVAKTLGVSETELLKDAEKQRKLLYSYQPATLEEGLEIKELAYIEENREKFPGIFIEANNYIRRYPLGEAGAHLIGYVGKPTKEEIERSAIGLSAEDLIGKEGIERTFNDVLRGTPGERLIEVDKNRRFRGELRLNPPVKGKDIYLTIDSNIQKKASELIGERPGAIIVMKPDTGEVLALVSSPSYDPNRFREKGGSAYLESILSAKQYPPMLNRALGNAYAPGSVVKPAILLRALEVGKVSEGTTFFCTGKLEVGNRTFYCWLRSGHGAVNLIDALGKSCDVAFYQIGLKLGPIQLESALRELGFGRTTGVSLPGEAEGIVPNPTWKRKHYSGEPYEEVDRIWYDGDTANLAIGQGFLLATPLQVLEMVNVIANDGKWISPVLIKGIREGDKILSIAQPRRTNLNPSSKYLEIVKGGLRRTSQLGGTAEKIPANLKLAGKTGTAETWKGEPHSWFAGYMPFDDPSVSFVIFLENGGSSLENAVPVAKELAKFLNDYLGG